MQETISAVRDRSPAHASAAEAPRFDMYTGVHKGLRAFMSHVLGTVGRAEPSDPQELRAALAMLRDLLFVCRVHLDDENRFVHPAMEARIPGASALTAEDHVGHEQAFDELEAGIQAVERAGDALRGDAQLRLYRQLARFVAENFEHMHVEETQNQPILWATYRDDELVAIHDALIASIPPRAMQLLLPWIVASQTHSDRVAMLAGMRAGAPAEVFAGMLSASRAALAPRDWARLAAALGVPAPAEPAEPAGPTERW